MPNSKLTKHILRYLALLVVSIATVIGLLRGKDLFSTPLDFLSNIRTQLWMEPKSPKPLIILGADGSCGYIYTSLPPKCRTSDGKFIPLPGTFSYNLVTAEGK